MLPSWGTSYKHSIQAQFGLRMRSLVTGVSSSDTAHQETYESESEGSHRGVVVAVAEVTLAVKVVMTMVVVELMVVDDNGDRQGLK